MKSDFNFQFFGIEVGTNPFAHTTSEGEGTRNSGQLPLFQDTPTSCSIIHSTFHWWNAGGSIWKCRRGFQQPI